MPSVYLTRLPWNQQRPRTLVIACSDGRLQENTDDFLQRDLAITHYDRLYVPGGAGALATSGFDYVRADHFWRECRFLLQAHAIQDLILLFHGPADGGPDEAVCADYRRKLPAASALEVRQQQDQDAQAIKPLEWGRQVQIRLFRCEVTAEYAVQFAAM
jgi:hypothetical protein